MSDSAPIRETFRRPGDPIRPGGATPAAQVPAAVRRIVTKWNEKLPRNKVRVLNQVRFQELVAALNDWTADEICVGIDFYSGQVWNKAKNAWATFDHFIGTKITGWVEKAFEAAELAQARGKAAPVIVTDLQKQIDSRQLVDRALQADLKRLENLPPVRRGELERLAVAELQKIRPGYRPNTHAIKRQAIVILKHG